VSVAYRMRQAGKALGGALKEEERREVGSVLSPPLMDLFLAMGPLGQRHGYEVYRTLVETGQRDPDLLAAGLLHDSGKGRHGLPSRAAWVLLETLGGEMRTRLASHRLFGRLFGLRQSLLHAESGASAADRAGASATTVRLIREHKRPQSGDPLLTALQAADDAN
jgi:hypothetical protein